MQKDDLSSHFKETHRMTRIFSSAKKFDINHQCDLCSYKTSHQHDLMRHKNGMHKNRTNENNSSRSSSLPRDQGSPPSPPFSPSPPSPPSPPRRSGQFQCQGSCSSLQKTFEHQDELDLHMSFFHEQKQQ